MRAKFTNYSPFIALLACLLAGFGFSANGQTAKTYGNEWINYSQQYYKIKVAQTGIHRITPAQLTAAGIPTVNSEKFQLFRRGKEVAIYVNGQAGQPLGTGNYIEFFGEKNDAKLDVEHYKDPSFQIQDLYSLYTDTAAYFLTWGTANGKRMVEKTSVSTGLTPEPRFYKEALRLKPQQYTAGTVYSEAKTTWGDRSEGFNSFAFDQRTDTIAGLTHKETTGRKPRLEIAIVSSYFPTANVIFYIKPPNGPQRVLVNNQTTAGGVLTFPSFHYRKAKFEIEHSDIYPDGSVKFRTGLADSATLTMPNYLRHSYFKLTYGHDLDLENSDQVIYTDSAKTGPSYFLFNNAPANAVAYDITDPYNMIRTTGVTSGGQRGFVFDPATFKRRIYITNEQNFIPATNFSRPNFTSVTAGKTADYIIITHPILHRPAPGTPYNDPPADYAAYRASAAGGGYNPFVADMDQLYDQFHYGEKSPYAIYNFMQWLIDNGNPEYLFLMGKGIEQSFAAGGYRKNPQAFLPVGQDLVPGLGDKPSDVLYSADWRNNNYVPRVATGRLPAISSLEVANYLNKVKANKLVGVEDWRKNIIHLGGGQNAGEVSLFKRYLENYENKVEGPLLGANVKTIIKKNPSVATTFVNIKDEVNAGLSLITFFGHSSPTVSDLDIGLVSNPINGYNNLGKYPMILMNGCGAGNAFQVRSNGNNLFSEDWMITPDKGAILFMADVASAIPSALNNYSSNFYTVAFTDSAFYGKPIGDIQRETIKRALAASSSISNVTVANQMVLQGDPAVRLFAPEKPDYLVKTNGLKLQSIPSGATVTASAEKFNLEIKIKNPGKAVEDSLLISVKRTLPNGDTIRYASVKYPPVFNDTTYTFTIDSKNVSGFGSNKFEVFLDYGNLIPELNENNNTAILNQFLSVNGVIALLPREYSIVSKQKVTLIGQPANLLSAPRDYYFEIDTAYTFNSPFRKSGVVQNAAGKISWPVTLLPNTSPKDSLVYYWRFRFNTFSGTEDTTWAESSFRYIPNSPEGWSQSNIGQFSKAQKTNIEYKDNPRQWEFGTIAQTLQLKTIGGGKQFTLPPFGIFQDGVAYFNNSCGYSAASPKILITAFDNRTLKPYTAHPRNRCGLDPPKAFYTFDVSTPALVDTLANFLNKIPNNYYVALISVNNVPFSTFTPSQKAAFQKVGSQLINTMQTGHPFGLVGKKGTTTGTLLQEKTYNPADTTAAIRQQVDFAQVITGQVSEGKIVSTRIGPASEWTSLHHSVIRSGWDKYKLDLYGYDSAGVRQLIEPDIKTSVFNLANVKANTIPYLQLEITKTDTAARTAPQLKQWMVVYKGVPEGMMRPELVGVDKYDVTKQIANGKIKLRFAFSNISNLPYPDSLTVVRSVTGSKALQDTIKVKKLLTGDSIFFDYEFSTAGMKGNNLIRVDVNPRILPEQYYFNNFLEIPFVLPKTDLHPVLDVAFDGVHIMDGDIVSPSPRISINLKDEDKYDFIKDPNKLEVFLKRPGQQNYEKIDLTDGSLVTLPNISDPNRDKRDFTVVYHPKNLPDGIYSLRVQGSDNSNQAAGFQPYVINFEVINESSITHFYPYPNPFTSNTRFVFTLTGNLENMPRNMKIQIMTLTGKVVREIVKEELGIIRVGNNISEPWDGTDEFGDKLANGVYLYRVVMEKPPLEEMKHRRTSADKSFTKEYGKLYILR